MACCGGYGRVSRGRRVSRACRAVLRTEGHAIAEGAVGRAAALWSNALRHPFHAAEEGLWQAQQFTEPRSGCNALCEGRLRGMCSGRWLEAAAGEAAETAVAAVAAKSKAGRWWW